MRPRRLKTRTIKGGQDQRGNFTLKAWFHKMISPRGCHRCQGEGPLQGRECIRKKASLETVSTSWQVCAQLNTGKGLPGRYLVLRDKALLLWLPEEWHQGGDGNIQRGFLSVMALLRRCPRPCPCFVLTSHWEVWPIFRFSNSPWKKLFLSDRELYAGPWSQTHHCRSPWPAPTGKCCKKRQLEKGVRSKRWSPLVLKESPW